MHLDPTAYLRIDAQGSLGTTSAGGSFATSTGDILEIACFGAGVFRLRIGPQTRPDYGIVLGRTMPCETTREGGGGWRFASGDAALEIADAPLALRLSWKDACVFESTTDLHVGGFTRLPAFGRLRQGGLWTAAFALASGEAVYGLGEKFGPLNKRGQLIHSQVEDALGVNTGLAYKNAPFAWSPGLGRGAWGIFVATPGMVTHGIGYPDWSHRSYAVLVEDEALDVFLFADDAPAGLLDRYTALTGRAPPVPRWSLGLWVSGASCASPEEAAATAATLRERRIPTDVIALPADAVWNPRTRFDFGWDPERIPDPAAALAKIKAHAHRVCVWECPYVSVRSPLFDELDAQGFLLRTAEGEPCVIALDTGALAATQDAEPAPPDVGIVDFTNPDAYAWWRDAHAPLFNDGVDAIESEGGEHVPQDAVAFNGDDGRRLHNVYPLLYNRCVFEATARLGHEGFASPVVWSRAGWSGSQRYPIGFGGAPQSDWEGLAASIRGGLSWAMSGSPYHGSDIGGWYGADAQPSAELYVRWLQAAVFGSHMRLHGGGERVPWAFGADAEAAAKKWLAFRYRLIPYLERTIAQAAQTGVPPMRAMPLAFPRQPFVRDFETQFMCGDALLVAPIVQAGGDVDIALPPGAWYDLNTRRRFAGRQLLRYRAKLDQFPVFGREGFALPLGRSVQHTGEIDTAAPLAVLWVFGKPEAPLEGFTQAAIEPDGDGAYVVRADGGFTVEVFGDETSVKLLR